MFDMKIVVIMMELSKVVDEFRVIKEMFFLEMEEISYIWSFFVVNVRKLLLKRYIVFNIFSCSDLVYQKEFYDLKEILDKKFSVLR